MRAVLLGVAVALALALGAGGGTPASAQDGVTTDVVLRFSELRPGEPQSASSPLHLIRTAELRDGTVFTPTGILADATIDVAICPASDHLSLTECVPLADAVGTVFDAGELDLVATVTLPSSAAPGGRGALSGRLVFSGDAGTDPLDGIPGAADRDLALTGSALPSAFAVGGLAALLAGIVLAVRRRRRDAPAAQATRRRRGNA